MLQKSNKPNWGRHLPGYLAVEWDQEEIHQQIEIVKKLADAVSEGMPLANTVVVNRIRLELEELSTQTTADVNGYKVASDKHIDAIMNRDAEAANKFDQRMGNDLDRLEAVRATVSQLANELLELADLSKPDRPSGAPFPNAEAGS